MSRPDGGPAFPAVPIQEYEGAISITPRSGMTLRDYFAAKAMAAHIANPAWANEMDTDVAANAYEYADAMLSERVKQ